MAGPLENGHDSDWPECWVWAYFAAEEFDVGLRGMIALCLSHTLRIHV